MKQLWYAYLRGELVIVSKNLPASLDCESPSSPWTISNGFLSLRGANRSGHSSPVCLLAPEAKQGESTKITKNTAFILLFCASYILVQDCKDQEINCPEMLCKTVLVKWSKELMDWGILEKWSGVLELCFEFSLVYKYVWWRQIDNDSLWAIKAIRVGWPKWKDWAGRGEKS